MLLRSSNRLGFTGFPQVNISYFELRCIFYALVTVWIEAPPHTHTQTTYSNMQKVRIDVFRTIHDSVCACLLHAVLKMKVATIMSPNCWAVFPFHHHLDVGKVDDKQVEKLTVKPYTG